MYGALCEKFSGLSDFIEIEAPQEKHFVRASTIKERKAFVRKFAVHS